MRFSRKNTTATTVSRQPPVGEEAIGSDSEHSDSPLNDRDVGRDRQRAGGVDEMEAIASTWSTRGLIIAWVGVLLASAAIALDAQTLSIYSNYATADFNKQSLLSTVQVVNGVVNVITRPILAKVIDVIGRFEGYLISVISIAIGHIMLATSPNIETYFAAQIFYTFGQVGIQFMQHVFAADTTDMVHRGIFIALPTIWYVFVPWLGGPITTAVLEKYSWRWGLGMWAVIVPACAIPILSILFFNKLKSRKLRPKKSVSKRHIVDQLDFGGSILLSAGLALVFIAIPLASAHSDEWQKPHIIVMVVLGGICLIIFPFYEFRVPRFPIMSFNVFRNIDICKSFAFIFLYYMAYNIFSPYFFSWLMVVYNLSNTTANNVNVVLTVAATAVGMITSFVIKYVKTLKLFILAGSTVALIGLGLVYHFRRPWSTVGQLVAGQLLAGIGEGLETIPNSVNVQSYCSHDEVAQTLALYHSFIAFGQVIGDAVSGAVYRRVYPDNLRRNLPNLSEKEIHNIINDMTKARSYPMGTDTRTAINASFNGVMRYLLIPPLVVYAVMWLLALTFRNRRMDGIFNVRGKIIGETKEEDSDYEPSSPVIASSTDRPPTHRL